MKLQNIYRFFVCLGITAFVLAVTMFCLPNSSVSSCLREMIRKSENGAVCSRLSLLATSVALDCKSFGSAQDVEQSYNIGGYELHFSSLKNIKQQFYDIFIQQIYAFPLNAQGPVIIDYGAEEGLDAAYFKLRFPAARFSFFENNVNVVPVLKKNLTALGLASSLVTGADGAAFIVEAAQSPIDILKMNYSPEAFALLQKLEAADSLKQVKHLIVRITSAMQKGHELGALFELLDRTHYKIQMRSFAGLDVRLLDEKARDAVILGLVVYAYRKE